MPNLGEFEVNRAYVGDCLELAARLPAESIDLVITSPPYWGQRTSSGVGVEADPRRYLGALVERFVALKRVLKRDGLLWINLGDAYNTPVNWRKDDHCYSSLGPDKAGLEPHNSAYTKPRLKRKAFEVPSVPWLRYGNLLALPYRLAIALCDRGFILRGEVIWRKGNPMPEGKCRRPHRAHEGIYLFVKSERHRFRVSPPVKSVWEFPNEHPNGVRHFSRFPLELPKRCIDAYGRKGPEVMVLDPFSGSATTGIAAIGMSCSYLGFEVEENLVAASNAELAAVLTNGRTSHAPKRRPRITGQTLFKT